MACLCGRCGHGVGRVVCRHCGHRCDSFVQVDFFGRGFFPAGLCPRCGCPAARPLNDPALLHVEYRAWPWPPEMEHRVRTIISAMISSRS